MPLTLPDFLVLAGGALAILELAFLVSRHPAAGVWLFASSAALATSGWPPGVVVADFQIYLLDVASIVLFLAAVMGVTARSAVRPNRALLIGFGLLALASARGIERFGTQVAVNATRGLLYVLVAALFAQVCGHDRLWEAVRRAWRLGAMVFIVVAALFWIRNGFGTYASGGDRALNSPQAFVVAHAGFMAIASGRDRRRQVFALACMATVLASQQRTVWAASLVTALVLAWHSGRAASPALRRSVRRGLAAALVAVILLLAIGPTGLRESATAAVAGDGAISTTSGNFGWRVEGWTALLGDVHARTVTDLAVGHPAGTSLERIVAGLVRTESPHNMYVLMVVALGYLGLTVIVTLYLQALARTRHREPLLFAIVASLCVYSIGYQLTPEHGLLLGLALHAGRLTERAPTIHAKVPA